MISRLLYRLLSKSPFSAFIELLSPLLLGRAIIINRKLTEPTRPLYLILTLDVESGYVDKTEKRWWQIDHPDLFQGFYFGLRNWLDMLEKADIKANFMLSSQCFSATGGQKVQTRQQLKRLVRDGHEIGYHLHPRSDHSLENIIGKKLNFTSARYYTEKEINDFLRVGRKLLEKNLGKQISQKVISFRWGNWGIAKKALRPLSKNGFKIDSSVCPKLVRHENTERQCNWAKIASPFPFYFRNSNILEIPTASFSLLGKTRIVDPVYYPLLKVIINNYKERGQTSDCPLFITILSHSSEGTYPDGKETQVVKDMQQFINWVQKTNSAIFITYNEARQIYAQYARQAQK